MGVNFCLNAFYDVRFVFVFDIYKILQFIKFLFHFLNRFDCFWNEINLFDLVVQILDEWVSLEVGLFK